MVLAEIFGAVGLGGALATVAELALVGVAAWKGVELGRDALGKKEEKK